MLLIIVAFFLMFFRTFLMQWRQPQPDGQQHESFEKMVATVQSCDGNMLHGISRSFANFLALANSAENHHRVRKLRTSLVTENVDFGLWPKVDSCGGIFQNLTTDKGIALSDVMTALKRQSVEVVLTAHPTEVNRRTTLSKLHRIAEQLERLDNPALPKYEQRSALQRLRAEIASIWGTDFLRRAKPSPVEEATAGLAVVENVLWNAIPSFLRKLDDVTRGVLKEHLPLDCAPIRIASWMGGDRDGKFMFLLWC